MRNQLSFQAHSWLVTLVFGFLSASYAYAADTSGTPNVPMNDPSIKWCQEAALIPLSLRAADIDGNDVLDARDASLVRSKLFTSDMAADLDSSGLVDITDLQTVLIQIARYEGLNSQCAGSADDGGAVFEMVVLPNMADRFYIHLEDPEMIEHARSLLGNSAAADPRRHVSGTVTAGTQSYNPDWNFYLEPSSIRFFDLECADCSAGISYVETNYDAWCNMVPGCHWCPWTSEIVREVH